MYYLCIEVDIYVFDIAGQCFEFQLDRSFEFMRLSISPYQMKFYRTKSLGKATAILNF